ncbi:MAG TPA: hypothetical protein VFG22_01970 [Polyangiales bacterium]|nr:hypothetical protein [Polyangiales bacterium]
MALVVYTDWPEHSVEVFRLAGHARFEEAVIGFGGILLPDRHRPCFCEVFYSEGGEEGAIAFAIEDYKNALEAGKRPFWPDPSQENKQ